MKIYIFKGKFFLNLLKRKKKENVNGSYFRVIPNNDHTETNIRVLLEKGKYWKMYIFEGKLLLNLPIYFARISPQRLSGPFGLQKRKHMYLLDISLY